ncbi:helix-turn-helix domain-containing protein [Pseudomonas sp. BIOMIG1BAC]|nr:helix-turn-helix domain-containing protein [Pseudomonas sp. BIOMIG1BAC]
MTQQCSGAEGSHRYPGAKRLNAAHRDLQQASPAHTTVAEIAMRHSFWHLGRFAEGYRELFYEQPKRTLQRCP